ncbi:MAG: efflux RND transporter periplasmic adaptor subunit [Alphaproteobacteria bacterium]|nr:efflux RND transporter periplasmic adaptor subunit [Alphaproteobacteria bacterium]
MRVFLIFVLLVFAVPASRADEPNICPMHPHIEGGPGDACPICGMDLVPARPKGNAISPVEGDGNRKEGGVHITPDWRQTLGVRTGIVESHSFGKTVRAFGRVEASTRLQYVVAVRAAGWVAELSKSAVGDRVEKGDLLFTYYSPDLMTAQSDYLIGRRGGSVVGDPAQRLRLYGMDDKAIAALNESGKMLDATPFHAPASGTVTALGAREGAYLPEGGAVMVVQDFSTVWVTADVLVRDVPYLEPGQGATVVLPETGEEFAADVDFIHPVADESTRTVPVRFVLANSDGRLRPGMAADVMVEAREESRLAVAADAVLYGAEGAYVILARENGDLAPKSVRVGITAHGMTEILGGLSRGDAVVVSGQFMIDAESSLRGGMAAMEHGPSVEGGDHVH